MQGNCLSFYSKLFSILFYTRRYERKSKKFEDNILFFSFKRRSVLVWSPPPPQIVVGHTATPALSIAPTNIQNAKCTYICSKTERVRGCTVANFIHENFMPNHLSAITKHGKCRSMETSFCPGMVAPAICRGTYSHTCHVYCPYQYSVCQVHVVKQNACVGVTNFIHENFMPNHLSAITNMENGEVICRDMETGGGI